MTSASTFFNETDRTAIANAIAEAEEHTSGQIVPVVATSSGRYDRAEGIFALLFALGLLALAWIVLPHGGATGWSQGVTPAPGLAGTIVIILGGYALGTWLATRFSILRTPFVSGDEMREEVERAAQAAFQMQKIRNTSRATGVLIYVSLYERMVRVIADDGVVETVPQQKWDAICQLVTDGMTREKPATGLAAAIALAGTILSDALPREAGAANELVDELVILD